MGDRDRDDKYWLAHGYFRTYELAGWLADIARAPLAYAVELEELTTEGRLCEFLPNWQKQTLIHRIAGWVADTMFIRDTSGPYVAKQDLNDQGEVEVRRYLPVDLAMRAYGISSEAFDVPPPDGELVEVRPKVFAWRESDEVANACYGYFMEDLRLTQEYEDLLAQLSDEVFHILFLNRVTLAGLNAIFANQVQCLDMDIIASRPDLRRLFVASGRRLKRCYTPEWVKRAVFFREHGRCASCGADLSGLLDVLPQRHFDHIIPIGRGGLNDVTNLQLLCSSCNAEKSDANDMPNSLYRRWYERAAESDGDRTYGTRACLDV